MSVNWQPAGPLPRDWLVLDEKVSRRLSRQLRREMPFGHPLEGHDCVAVAGGADPDDVLFRVDNDETPYALVHLSWSVQSDPKWPWTVTFANWAEFVEAQENE